MTKIIVKELIWDEWNVKHIKKHDVEVAEAEVAGYHFVYHRVTYDGRYLAIGRSGLRILTLVLKRLSTGKYYPISVRDSSKKEREGLYEKEKKKIS